MKYGSLEVPLALERETTLLVHREPPPDASPETLRTLLQSRIPLAGHGVSTVGIVVADKTRLCQYPDYLPVLTSYLLEAGIASSAITFHIAYGTHAPQSEQECIESYGETYSQFRFVHHDSRDTKALQTLGRTSRGTTVTVAAKVLEYDLLISFGAILHHYFAGYGGGRKLLFPGLAGYESILQNHRLYLDFKTRRPAAGCLPGELGHNPLALDLEEINNMLPPRLEIHALLNSQKQVCGLYAGSSYGDFREVCKRYDRYFRYPGTEQFDLVVASAGGYPKDINFIQAHKSIHNAAAFVKNGGKLIIFAECRDGIGNPAFMELFKPGGRDAMFDLLGQSYENNAGTALAMLEKTERIRIRMVTTLSPGDCRAMGAGSCGAEEVQGEIDRATGSVAVIENAGMLYR